MVISEVQQLEDTIEYMQERIAELEFQQEDEGWQRINSGESLVEFTKAYLDRIVARSRLYFLINPLINRAVSLQADYVFAQGVHIQATDKEVNEVVQDFLDDVGNQKELIGHQARLMKEQTLMLDGGIYLLLFTDKEVTGRVQVRSVLVDEIVDIITDPDDANQVWYYQREWYSRKSATENKRNVVLYPDINFDPGPRKPKTYQGMRIEWAAPIKCVKVGSLSKSRYGVPEVYSALEWAKAHKNFLTDWLTIVRAYARFAFKLTTVGGKNAVTAAKTRLNTTVGQAGQLTAETNPPPLAGSTFIRSNKDVDIEPIKTAGATTSAQDGREIRMMVAAALGIPDTFFGDVDVGNLATARTLDRPTELKYKSRQELWKEAFTEIINYVIFWAAYAKQGRLKNKIKLKIVDGKTVFDNSQENDAKRHIEVMFPPILEHSIIDRINAIANAVTLNGKQFAVDSPELVQLTMRLMLQALSVPDVDEIISKLTIGQTAPENNDNGRDARPTGI